MIKKLLFLSLLSVGFSNSLIGFTGEKVVERTYCSVFGSENASDYYQEKVKEALTAFGVNDVNHVPIKKMNRTAAFFVGDQLYSFTMFGIWLNEELLDKCEESERVFALYHEAAHYARKHHQKVLLSLLPTALLVEIIPLIRKQMVKSPDKYVQAGSTIGLTLLAALLVDQLLLCPLIKSQEQEADEQAACKLNSLGRTSVVDDCVKQLHELLQDGHSGKTDRWHRNIPEQIAYLEKV